MMHTHYVLPIRKTAGQLIAVEMVLPVWDSYRQMSLLLNQHFTWLIANADVFHKHNLLCIIKTSHLEAMLIDSDSRLKWLINHLPFVRFMTDAGAPEAVIKNLKHNNYAVWLKNYGPDVARPCEAMILQPDFYQQIVQQTLFPEVIKKLKKYSEHIIVADKPDLVDMKWLEQCGIWAVQGEAVLMSTIL